jgi:ubiquinone/menaquinone biosynthesis C-methylase UbiE
MAGSYDELEPWYTHLYQRVHAILRAQLRPPADGRRRRSLDVGCGTGFQAVLLADLGYESHGVDISAGLLAIARSRLRSPTLALGDVEALPYRDATFDVVSCCGSTLSFVERADRALGEIGRVLRPGGVLLLECEHKWSLDLAWSFASALTGDPLRYGVAPRDVWRQVARPLREGSWLQYPAPSSNGSFASMRLRLYTRSELRRLLGGAGLTMQRAWGIHMLTNLIPSTVLHRDRLGAWLARCYAALCRLDGALERARTAQAVANSLVLLAQKAPGGPSVPH